MAQLDSSTPEYTLGFGRQFVQSQRQLTAETSAAYLLPFLKPGLRVLDFGCGPGSISVGLAKAVEPGELHGVDMEQSQIDLSREIARANGCGNAIFHVADVTALPFEDSFFDVAHCHNVLLHIPVTDSALSEVKRVLKPGGLIACREIILGSSFSHPEVGIMRKLWDMYDDLLAADYGHPEMGKALKSCLLKSGFTNIRASSSFSVYDKPEEILIFYDLVIDGFLSRDITNAAIKYGAWTEGLSQEVRDAFHNWKAHPGAIAAFAYGEALANKP